jgi:hypothetical protein
VDGHIDTFVPLDTQLIHALCAIEGQEDSARTNPFAGVRSQTLELHPHDTAKGLAPWCSAGGQRYYLAKGAEIVLVECTLHETQLIEKLNPWFIDQVSAICCGYFVAGSATQVPRIYCFGTQSDLACLPDNYGKLFNEYGYRAFWSTSEHAGFLNISKFDNSTLGLARAIVHELVHGFMDFLCLPYQIPYCVNEGLALAIEVRLLRDHADYVPLLHVGWKVPPGNLCLIWARGWSILRTVSMEFTGIVPSYSERQAAYWFLVFLGQLSCSTPDLRGFLQKLKSNRITSNDLVPWLCDTVRCSAAALENYFKEFLACEVSSSRAGP